MAGDPHSGRQSWGGIGGRKGHYMQTVTPPPRWQVQKRSSQGRDYLTANASPHQGELRVLGPVCASGHG